MAFKPHAHPATALTTGCLLALGAHHRVSFLVFALPPVLHWLFHEFKFTPSTAVVALTKLALTIVAFFAAAAALTGLDAALQGAPPTGLLYSATSVRGLGPVRAFTAAFQPGRLRGRLVQPPFYHLALSLPVNFGPAAALALLWAAQSLRPTRLAALSPAYWFFLSAFLAPLALLSLYPLKGRLDVVPAHVPLLFLAVIRTGPCCVRDAARRRFIAAWLLFHAGSLLYWGWAHLAAHLPLFTLLTATPYPPSALLFADLPRLPLPLLQLPQKIRSNETLLPPALHEAWLIAPGSSPSFCRLSTSYSAMHQFQGAIAPGTFDLEILRLLIGSLLSTNNRPDSFSCLQNVSFGHLANVLSSVFVFA